MCRFGVTPKVSSTEAVLDFYSHCREHDDLHKTWLLTAMYMLHHLTSLLVCINQRAFCLWYYPSASKIQALRLLRHEALLPSDDKFVVQQFKM